MEPGRLLGLRRALRAARARSKGRLSNENAIFVRKDGGVSQPRTGRAMKPKPLGGPEADYVRGEDPRQRLVDWMTAPENPYFAKSIVNRMWAHFLGVGLGRGRRRHAGHQPADEPRVAGRIGAGFRGAQV